MVGTVSNRASSLTHVVPPGTYPKWPLASCYPDFLRNRIGPARHDVVAEEVDKELPLTDKDACGFRREPTWLSSEIRDFLKNKDASGAKGGTWARAAEMTGFSPGGFGFSETRLGAGTYNRERKAAMPAPIYNGQRRVAGRRSSPPHR